MMEIFNHTTCVEVGCTAQLQIQEENIPPTLINCIPSYVISIHCLLLPQTKIYWPPAKLHILRGIKLSNLSFPNGLPEIE